MSYHVLRGLSPLNSLWCHCRHRTKSSLAHVMDCWRAAASPYLNQCWRIINCGWKTLTKEQFHKCSRYPFVKWFSWWRHQMETFSALLAICAGNSPVPGKFPTQRPVTRSFDVYFDLRPNKRLSKQSLSWWFETLSPPLWRHRNVKNYTCKVTSPSRWGNELMDVLAYVFYHNFK